MSDIHGGALLPMHNLPSMASPASFVRKYTFLKKIKQNHFCV